MVLAAHNIEQLGKARILVIGDVMLDRYWMGGVDRISPEAPVPVVAVSEVEERAGGAGNVARNITSLGGRCTLLGIVGDDEAGVKFNEITTASGVEVDLEIQKGLDTTVKLRVLSRNQQLLRADFETLPERTSLDSLAKKFRKLGQSIRCGDLFRLWQGDVGRCGVSDQNCEAGIHADPGRPQGIEFQKVFRRNDDYPQSR